jgi:hypothetical protein
MIIPYNILFDMEAFARVAPEWTKTATHALTFNCPRCHGDSRQAKKVWLNRHSPVIMEDYTRKWQEFYLCECDQVWWAWNCDRTPLVIKDD